MAHARPAGPVDLDQLASVTVVLRRRGPVPTGVVDRAVLALAAGADPADLLLVEQVLTGEGLQVTVPTRRCARSASPAVWSCCRRSSGLSWSTSRARTGRTGSAPVRSGCPRPSPVWWSRSSGSTTGLRPGPIPPGDRHADVVHPCRARRSVRLPGGHRRQRHGPGHRRTRRRLRPGRPAGLLRRAGARRTDRDGGGGRRCGRRAGRRLGGAVDVEVAGALAPGAAIVVYFAPNTDAGFLDAVTAASHATGGTSSPWPTRQLRTPGRQNL